MRSMFFLMGVILIQFIVGTNLRSVDELNETSLHIALAKGDISDAQRFLLETPSLINVRDKHGDTPLGGAVKKKQYAMVEFLLRNGADVNAVLSLGDTPLHCAAREGDIILVNRLLDVSNIDLRIVNHAGVTAETLAKNLSYFDCALAINAADGRNLVDELGLPSTISGFSPEKGWFPQFKCCYVEKVVYYSHILYGNMLPSQDGNLYSFNDKDKDFSTISVAAISCDENLTWHLPSLKVLEIRTKELLGEKPEIASQLPVK
jgi:hypothetical protein